MLYYDTKLAQSFTEAGPAPAGPSVIQGRAIGRRDLSARMHATQSMTRRFLQRRQPPLSRQGSACSGKNSN